MSNKARDNGQAGTNLTQQYTTSSNTVVNKSGLDVMCPRAHDIFPFDVLSLT
jgi:hypothetical protein